MGADRHEGFPLSQTELVAWAGSFVEPARTNEELIRAAEETELFLGIPIDLPQGRRLGSDSATVAHTENITTPKSHKGLLRRIIRPRKRR